MAEVWVMSTNGLGRVRLRNISSVDHFEFDRKAQVIAKVGGAEIIIAERGHEIPSGTPGVANAKQAIQDVASVMADEFLAEAYRHEAAVDYTYAVIAHGPEGWGPVK